MVNPLKRTATVRLVKSWGKKCLLPVLFLGLSAFFPTGIRAEENRNAASSGEPSGTWRMEASLAGLSNYVWRGYELGCLCVSPTFDIGYTSGKGIDAHLGTLAVEVYKESLTGSFLDHPVTRVYPYASVSYKDLSLTVCDYIESSYQGNSPTYHAFDFTLRYHPLKQMPLYLSWSTMLFGGADAWLDTENKVHQSYTSYVEGDYYFRLGPVQMNAHLGAMPWNTPYMEYLYPDLEGFQVTELHLSAQYTLSLGKRWNFPLSATFGVNPAAKEWYGYLMFPFIFHR